MVLEGVVTNVAAFGAFVDVGVHQDGLVHVSAMADRFVSDPHEVVRSGQVVRVKVLEVDVDRQRIGLTLRLNETRSGARASAPTARAGPSQRRQQGPTRAAKPSRGKNSGQRNRTSPPVPWLRRCVTPASAAERPVVNADRKP